MAIFIPRKREFWQRKPAGLQEINWNHERADDFSSGGTTQFDTTASGNADGCNEAEIEIDVTGAPTGAARCEVYQEAVEHDGTGNSANKFIGSVAIPVATGKYIVRITDISEKGNITIKAINYGFEASASMRGIYPADT